MDLEPGLHALLEQHKPHFVVEGGKVKCLLNGHCFPPRLDAVSAFVG